MLNRDHIVAAHPASGGGRVIVGLVVAAVMFLAMLLAFGETVFSDRKPGPDHVRGSNTEITK